MFILQDHWHLQIMDVPEIDVFLFMFCSPQSPLTDACVLNSRDLYSLLHPLPLFTPPIVVSVFPEPQLHTFCPLMNYSVGDQMHCVDPAFCPQLKEMNSPLTRCHLVALTLLICHSRLPAGTRTVSSNPNIHLSLRAPLSMQKTLSLDFFSSCKALKS